MDSLSGYCLRTIVSHYLRTLRARGKTDLNPKPQTSLRSIPNFGEPDRRATEHRSAMVNFLIEVLDGDILLMTSMCHSQCFMRCLEPDRKDCRERLNLKRPRGKKDSHSTGLRLLLILKPLLNKIVDPNVRSMDHCLTLLAHIQGGEKT